MAGELFYFAWVEEGTPWSAALERYDQVVLSAEIQHDEGDIAALKVELVNDGTGLLSEGRLQWAWLAWNDSGTARPLFYGRIEALPENLHLETINVELLAKPTDYEAAKAALAATLRQLPYVEPLFQAASEDLDTVLEARSAVYHVNRLTHAITISDIAQGEDGLVEIFPDEHSYEDLNVEFGSAPLKTVQGKITVTYTQAGEGVVDATQLLVDRFRAVGSFMPWPLIESYSSRGLLDAWPNPGTGIGGGWAMAEDSSAEIAVWLQPILYTVRYSDKSEDAATQWTQTGLGRGPLMFGGGFTTWNISFPIVPLKVNFRLAYSAARKRTETVTWTMTAAVQRITQEDDGTETELLELSSSDLDKPIDEGGAMPIVDLRRNAFSPTSRGELAIQHGLLLSRAKLIERARTATITVHPLTWAKVWNLDCRKNMLVYDRRLPFGQASGKVKGVRLLADPDHGMASEVKIGVCIGLGTTLPAPVPMENSYANDYANDWTEDEPGGLVALIPAGPGQVQYESLAGAVVVDDDGIDLFNMIPETTINSLVIVNGPNEQQAQIDLGKRVSDPLGYLQAVPTRLTLNMKPLAGEFLTNFPINVLPLTIPRGIDLEAFAEGTDVTREAVATAHGSATAVAISTSTAVSTGTAAGSATAVAIAAGGAELEGIGTAAGTSTATAIGRAIVPTVGTAAGTSTASATGLGSAPTVGTASGTSTATATGLAISQGIGTAAGTSTATGVGDGTADSAMLREDGSNLLREDGSHILREG